MRLSILVSTLIIAVTTTAALPAASENKGNSDQPIAKCKSDSDRPAPHACSDGHCKYYPGIPGVKRQDNDRNPFGCAERIPTCPGMKRDQSDYPPSGKPCSDSSDCEEKLEFCNPNMGKCVTKPHFGGS